MIKITPKIQSKAKPVKAVGLLSGGLDSTLAAKVIRDLGIEVYGVYFAMPWGCCDKGKAQEAADRIGIPMVALQLDERYLEMVREPQHGYGKVMNPCVDCRIHMFKRAAQYMKHIGADFVFTGEVLGQRNMSQLRRSLTWVEEGAGLTGRLLRPLCAKNLKPTLVEQEGLVDREKLLQFAGRSRRPQLDLAKKLDIKEFNTPAGGCLLTDPNFARRMKDTFDYGYRNFRETVALQWGRHYRIDENFKAILGRDENENNALIHYAHRDDMIMQLHDNRGATLILKGKNPSKETLIFCGGIIKHFSKYKTAQSTKILYWENTDKNSIQEIEVGTLDEQKLEPFKI